MKLRSIDLNQFRCFKTLRTSLPEGIAILYGDNAQGKTSILEAICILLRLQSPRTSVLTECIRFGDTGFAIGGQLESESNSCQLRLQVREKDRKLIVDGENQKRSTDYLRQTALVVWMANDDLALVRGGGEGRRRYLDFMACQLFPEYRTTLKAYEKALRTRNFLLKRDASPQWPQIDAYTKILSEQGAVLTARRRELILALEPHASTAQYEISGSSHENLQLRYQSASGGADHLFAELARLRSEEYRKRRTVAGPHLDELELQLDGKPASRFGSEGQQRTVALALKLAQTRLFIQRRSQPPILLIDDIFGELDPARRNSLMAAWPEESQKLITTTHLDWLDERFDQAVRLQVNEGEVRE